MPDCFANVALCLFNYHLILKINLFYLFIYCSKTRHKRQTNPKTEIHIEGFRIEGADKPPTLNVDGIPEIFSNTDIKLRLFGNGLTEHTVIIFTQEAHEYGGSCQLPETGVFEVRIRQFQ